MTQYDPQDSKEYFHHYRRPLTHGQELLQSWSVSGINAKGGWSHKKLQKKTIQYIQSWTEVSSSSSTDKWVSGFPSEQTSHPLYPSLLLTIIGHRISLSHPPAGQALSRFKDQNDIKTRRHRPCDPDRVNLVFFLSKPALSRVGLKSALTWYCSPWPLTRFREMHWGWLNKVKWL